MASVGTHIKRLRAAKRMTQEELAEQLHVTRQAVSAWETGKALPDVEMLERIAAALDADVTEVIYGAKSAPDLAALKREWTQRGIGWGLWLAILYYVLFCCGVWGSWTRGLSYQFSNKDYRVMEEVLPGSWSIDVNPREVYNGAKPVIYFGPMGCQTGFYFLYDSRLLDLAGAVALVQKVFAQASVFEGEMPGKSAAECGNYRNLDVDTGKAVCKWYADLIRDWTVEGLAYE